MPPSPAIASNVSELRALLAQPGTSSIRLEPAEAVWSLGGTPLVVEHANVSIDAAGGTLDAADLSRVFEVGQGGRLSVRNVHKNTRHFKI